MLSYSAEDSWAEATALAVADDLKRIGIDVQLEKSDNAGTLDQLLNQRYDMVLSFLYDYSNMPDGMLDFGFGPSLNANFSGYKPPPGLERTIRTAVTTSGGDRQAALAQVNKQFLEDQPYVTLETLTFTTVSRYDERVVALDQSGFVAIGRKDR
jgi:ABC-type transport system substrate-binding protein